MIPQTWRFTLSYITLDIFTASALTVAAFELTQADVALAAKKICLTYQNDYDDYNLEKDLIESKDTIIKSYSSTYPALIRERRTLWMVGKPAAG